MIENTEWLNTLLSLSEGQLYLVGFTGLTIMCFCFWFLTRSWLVSGVLTMMFSTIEWFMELLPSQYPPVPWVTFVLGILIVVMIMCKPEDGKIGLRNEQK